MIPYKSLRPMAVPKTLEVRLELLRAIGDLMAEARSEGAVQKYDPDQPRVPDGNPDGGQWINEGSSQGSADNQTNIVVAARRKQLEAECDAQYNRDMALCRMVRTPLCYERAMARYVACMGEEPLPPLRF